MPKALAGEDYTILLKVNHLRCFSAIIFTALAMRLLRVAGRFASPIHFKYSR